MDLNHFTKYLQNLKKESQGICESNNQKHYFFEPSDKKPGPREEGHFFHVYSASLDAQGHEVKKLYKKDMKVDHPDEIKRFVRGLNFQSLRKGQPVKESEGETDPYFHEPYGHKMQRGRLGYDIYNHAREIGKKARREGKTRDQNPFHPKKQGGQHHSWNDGYFATRLESYQSDTPNLDAIYKEGQAAAKSGKKLSDNPYVSVKHKNAIEMSSKWRDGFNDAGVKESHNIYDQKVKTHFDVKRRGKLLKRFTVPDNETHHNTHNAAYDYLNSHPDKKNLKLHTKFEQDEKRAAFGRALSMLENCNKVTEQSQHPFTVQYNKRYDRHEILRKTALGHHELLGHSKTEEGAHSYANLIHTRMKKNAPKKSS